MRLRRLGIAAGVDAVHGKAGGVLAETVEIETAEPGVLRDAGQQPERSGRRGNAEVRNIEAGLERVGAADRRQVVDQLPGELLAARAPAVVANGDLAVDIDVG